MHIWNVKLFGRVLHMNYFDYTTHCVNNYDHFIGVMKMMIIKGTITHWNNPHDLDWFRYHVTPLINEMTHSFRVAINLLANYKSTGCLSFGEFVTHYSSILIWYPALQRCPKIYGLEISASSHTKRHQCAQIYEYVTLWRFINIKVDLCICLQITWPSVIIS